LATDLPPLPSLRELTMVGSYDGPSAVDTLAASFPQLEHLHVACVGFDFSLLFARLASLSCIKRCWPRGTAPRTGASRPSTQPLSPEPARRARHVPRPSWAIDDAYVTLYPNVEHLHLQVTTTGVNRVNRGELPMICALTKLRVLAIAGDGFRGVRNHHWMRRSDPIGAPADAATARLLASLPVLEVLDLSVYNGRNMHLTFASTDYDGVVAPQLRVLKAAGAGRLREEGLRALARICPNLRHLDVRAAFAMSRRDFVDGLVEFSPATPPPAPVGADDGGGGAAQAARRQTQRLRLPKLRRLYSSFNRQLPKVLKFNVYRSGWTDVRRDESGALGEPRDVETEPLLEPEYIMVRFRPRSNNRRLVLCENRGLPVDVRIVEPVPGEFPL
jgi:hypothetical protein